MSDSLRPHESQHTRPPCPSPTPRVHSESHPLSQWCHPTISSSVTHFSSCSQSFPASGSFPGSQLFTSGSQSSIQFSSVAQSCPTLCDLMNRSTPGHPVHHQLPELTQTHVHWVNDESNHLNLCCPLLLLPLVFPSIRVFSNESTLHIRWPSIGVSASASVLPMNTQDWSPLEWMGWISLQSKGLSRVFFNTTVQKHQFFGAQLSL